jgi:hypothetical protein
MSGRETELRKLMRAELARSKEADPRVVANRLALKLDDDARAAAISYGLKAIAHEEVHFARMEAAEYDPNPARVGPSRRSVVLRERVWVDREWKILDDCDVDDLLWIADDYRRQSEQLAEKERVYVELAEELRRSGCATVGDMRRAERRAAA